MSLTRLNHHVIIIIIHYDNLYISLVTLNTTYVLHPHLYSNLSYSFLMRIDNFRTPFTWINKFSMRYITIFIVILLASPHSKTFLKWINIIDIVSMIIWKKNQTNFERNFYIHMMYICNLWCITLMHTYIVKIGIKKELILI